MHVTYRQIGLELNRSDKTIKRALTCTPEVIAQVKELKQEVADLYENLAQQILESITDETIKEAKLRDRVISAGVCIDKSRLLKEESTSNISIRNGLSMRYDKLISEIEELEKKLENET